MFEWKFIIILLILKISSIIFVNYYSHSSEKKITDLYLRPETEKNSNSNYKEYITEEENKCITINQRNFMICWVKYTVDMIDCSKAIIKNLPNYSNYYRNLINTRDELIKSFETLHSNSSMVNDFSRIINQQIEIKINLCQAIKKEDKDNILYYSKSLVTNTQELGKLFGEIKQNKEIEEKIKESMAKHSNLYIKSVRAMGKVTNIELTRQLIIGSFDTLKILF